MQAEITDAVWLETEGEFSIAELAERCGLAESQLRELVDYGALLPLNPRETGWRFGGECLGTVRTAYRLHRELELEPFALALMLQLLQRIGDLETQICRLRAQKPRR
ncbi:MAG: chaperone modulator CbpM [Betaproteobacteria bacterium]